MNNPDIRRYGQELQKTVHGFRLRRKIMRAFYDSLAPLLEEFPTPSYDDLNEAFGPPEQMAQLLLQTIPNLPRPLKRGHKVYLAVALFLIMTAAAFVGFTLWNTSEEETLLFDSNAYPETIVSQLCYAADEVFSHRDTSWDQLQGMTAYLIELHNTNKVPTKITINYAKYQPPHTFELAAGEQCTFLVNDARTGKHTISFVTPDGSLSGTVRVMLSDTELPTDP